MITKIWLWWNRQVNKLTVMGGVLFCCLGAIALVGMVVLPPGLSALTGITFLVIIWLTLWKL